MLITSVIPERFALILPKWWRRSVKHIERRYLPRLDTQRCVHDVNEPLIFVADLAQPNTFAIVAPVKLHLSMFAQPQCLFEGLRYFVGELSVNPSWNAAALGDHLS